MIKPRHVLLDSTKLKPLTSSIDIPIIDVSKIPNPLIRGCITSTSPRRPLTPTKLVPIVNYEEKLVKLGKIEFITKAELINNFEIGHFSFLFWTCVQTKSLGTFLVIKSPDAKMHFISMRKKLFGCNFQYNQLKKCIYTKTCDGMEFSSLNDISFYEFPEDTIILTPDEPYEIPNILSKI